MPKTKEQIHEHVQDLIVFELERAREKFPKPTNSPHEGFAVLKEEIEESKKVIEYKLNKKCNYFAYPNGDFTDYSNEIVKENYSLGFSTKRKERISKGSNREIIPRMGIHSDFNFSKVQITLFPF